MTSKTQISKAKTKIKMMKNKSRVEGKRKFFDRLFIYYTNNVTKKLSQYSYNLIIK